MVQANSLVIFYYTSFIDQSRKCSK